MRFIIKRKLLRAYNNKSYLTQSVISVSIGGNLTFFQTFEVSQELWCVGWDEL